MKTNLIRKEFNPNQKLKAPFKILKSRLSNRTVKLFDVVDANGDFFCFGQLRSSAERELLKLNRRHQLAPLSNRESNPPKTPKKPLKQPLNRPCVAGKADISRIITKKNIYALSLHNISDLLDKEIEAVADMSGCKPSEICKEEVLDELLELLKADILKGGL